MEQMLRIAAAAVCTLLVCLLLRKTNPELAALLSMAAVAVILMAAISMSEGLREMKALLQERFGLNETMLLPVFKCVAAAIVTRLTADLCKDASQTAAASAVELAGTLCALGLVLPLVMTMLKMLGDLL